MVAWKRPSAEVSNEIAVNFMLKCCQIKTVMIIKKTTCSGVQSY
jgi:hypothetical protein